MKRRAFLTVRPKLLLIDAVDWDPIYPDGHPLKSVPSWFRAGLGSATVDGPDLDVWHTSALPDSLEGIADYQGVIMSGSPRDAWADDPLNDRLCELVRRCGRESVPFLGVCFGHQILARAHGGRVHHHPAGLQLGNVAVERLAASDDCPLFDGLPETFNALSGHNDTVLELPPNGRLLARSAQTVCHAFVIGTNQFGVQFHPEFTPDILRFLWTPRIPIWHARVGFDIQATLDGLKPTDTADRILKNFATHCSL